MNIDKMVRPGVRAATHPAAIGILMHTGMGAATDPASIRILMSALVTLEIAACFNADSRATLPGHSGRSSSII